MKMTYKEMVKHSASQFKGDERTMWASIGALSDRLEKFVEKHPAFKEEYWEMMREQHELIAGCHFNEPYALWEVERMHHKGNDGVEYKGEHWSIEETNGVLPKYRSRIPAEYNEWDFYVALNATYHDFCAWAKKHFAERAEEEIIDIAIVFWFGDEDWDGATKVWDYFRKKACK